MVRALQLISSLVMAAMATAMPTATVPRDADDVESIGHKDVVGFEESAAAVVLKFKPTLKVDSGCVPWPAVDKEGRVSAGLKNTGSPTGECGSNDGQVYARATYHNDRLAIMYSWYFPKDQPAHSATGSGHRHDWENVVIWVTDNTEDAELVGIAYSGHGKYGHTSVEDLEEQDYLLDGIPKVRYFTNGFTNHELGLTTAEGGTQPAIEWGELTEEARYSLSQHVFRDAVVPFSDREDKFKKSVADAWHDAFGA